MAVQEPSDIEKSEQYDDLSPKRQEIVDAWARLYEQEGEEPKNVDVVEEADSDPSYVSEVLSEFKDVAKARVEVKDNEREQGEVKTEGDPFQGKLEENQGGYQTIKERPTKPDPQTDPEPQETESEASGFTYEFTPEEVRRIAFEKELPEGLATKLQQMVVERAFDR